MRFLLSKAGYTVLMWSSRFALHPDMTLRTIAETLPFTYTGADLYALCSDAMLKAITRQAGRVDEKIRVMSEESGEPISTAYFFDHVASEEDTTVVVGLDDFASAKSELVGSVRFVFFKKAFYLPFFRVLVSEANIKW